MKRSNFTALIMGTVAGVLFALGMCMSLLPEWNVFGQGIILGIAGVIVGLLTVIVWRKMEGKPKTKLKLHSVALCLFGIFGVLIFGTGMCFCILWKNIVLGSIIGLIGIIMLISLIPMIKGIK